MLCLTHRIPDTSRGSSAIVEGWATTLTLGMLPSPTVELTPTRGVAEGGPVPVVVYPRGYYSPYVRGGYGGRWHHADRDWHRDEYGTPYRGGWQPVPRDGRRHPHE